MNHQDLNPTPEAPKPEPTDAIPAAPNPAPPAPVPEKPAEDNEDKTETDPLKTTISVNIGDVVAKTSGQACPKCGHVNRPGVLVCENCGTLLINEEQSVGTKRFGEGEIEDEEIILRPGEMQTAELVNSAVSTAGSTQFSENMLLRLEIDAAPTPLLISPKDETFLGRRDPATGTTPDVDLSAYAGYRLGVSRKHAVIKLKNQQLEISDLGSSNGTSVNGIRLTPHQPQTLRDGDEIMLGKMMIRVLFQARSRRR